MGRRSVLGMLLLVILTLLLVGCRGRERTLRFETIERSEMGGGHNAGRILQPALVVIGDPAEIGALDDTVSPEAVKRLAQVDFTRYFVVVAYHGWYSQLLSPKSGVEVRRIRQQGTTITVEALFYKPTPGLQRRQMETYPYHIVQVRRNKQLRGEFTFVLEVDGKVVAREDASLGLGPKPLLTRTATLPQATPRPTPTSPPYPLLPPSPPGVPPLYPGP